MASALPSSHGTQIAKTYRPDRSAQPWPPFLPELKLGSTCRRRTSGTIHDVAVPTK
jgi:hypothetical protein